jgi:hypothetical protein
MSDARCATCKHWVPFEKTDDAERLADLDPADQPTDAPDAHVRDVVMVRRLGLCRKADGIVRDPTSLAIAEDGSDYRARFRTAATFGCVMHEPTDPKTNT